MKSQEYLRIKERKRGIATITVAVIQVSIVTNRWSSQENSRLKDKHGVGFIIINSSAHSNNECYQQKSGSKRRDSSTVGDKNGKIRKTFVEDTQPLSAIIIHAAVTVKSKRSQLKVELNIHYHLGLDSVLPLVIYSSLIKQTVFSCWQTRGLLNT